MTEELKFDGKPLSEINYLFFDNDMEHILATKKFCPNITCVHVPETPSILEAEYCRRFVGNHRENSYTQFCRSSAEPVTNGIRISDIDKIISWAKTKGDHPRDMKIFFDWDRTLSCVEGFMAPPSEPGKFRDYGINVNDVVAYLMGSPSAEPN